MMDFKVNIIVCRVCMKSEEGKSLLKDSELREKFIFTTHLKVNDDDNMPDVVCIKCVARLKIAYEFVQTAYNSEKHLRSFLTKITNDFREVAKTTSIHNTSSLDELEDQDVIQLINEEFELSEENDNGGTKTPIENFNNGRNFSKKKVKNPLVSENDDPVKLKITKEESNVIISTLEDDLDQELNDLTNNSGNDENEDDQEDEREIENLVEFEGKYMEEFHEVIQENGSDSNQFIDENSSQFDLFKKSEDDDVLEPDTDSVYHVTTSSETCQEENEIKVYKSKKLKNETQVRRSRSRNTTVATSNICIMCNRDFSTKTNLMRHMLSHDGRKPYQCNVCGKGFTQNGSLKQHMYIHTGEKPHVCSVCGRGFTQGKSLVFHLRRHTGEKPFDCSFCGIAFRQKDGLKHHVAKHHSNASTEETTGTEKHTCVICKKSLSSKYSLQVHMKKHSDQNEDKRTATGKNDKNLAGKIKREQSDIKIIDVTSIKTISSTAKSTPSSPSKEIAVPTKLFLANPEIVRPKRFKCEKCSKSFAIKQNLLQHLSNHKVKSSDLHQCNECKIGFNSRRTLKLHRQRDHNEKVSDLNSCEYCDLPFSYIAELKEHIAEVHDAIDENCPYCPSMNFKSQKLFTEHMLEHEHMLNE